MSEPVIQCSPSLLLYSITTSALLAGASLEPAAGWDELIGKAINDPTDHRLYQQVKDMRSDQRQLI